MDRLRKKAGVPAPRMYCIKDDDSLTCIRVVSRSKACCRVQPLSLVPRCANGIVEPTIDQGEMVRGFEVTCL